MGRVSSYTVEKKLAVVSWHKSNGNNMHKTSREFAIDRKRIREWVNKEQELSQHAFGQEKKRRKLGSGRKPLSEELDDSLFEFLEAEREAGRAVSNKLLSCEALKIAASLNLTNFKATDPYIRNWKRRFSVSMRKGTNDSQKTPEELSEAVSTFLSCVKSVRAKNDYSLFNIGNMDQTMVRFDCPNNRTNNVRGESTIRIANTGCQKRGFTVALTARASGHKMPAFCIFKEPSGRIPPRVFSNLRIPNNVIVAATTNGWMTGEKFNEWVSRVWKGNEDDVRRLLILDQAPIHVTKAARQEIAKTDTDLTIIPGGCTRLLQPADVSWNKPFKAALTENWEKFMRITERNAKGNLKRPTRQDLVNWISEAWKSVSEDVVKKSFKVCGISASLDGSENGLFHENLCRAISPGGEDLTQERLNLLFQDDESDSEFEGFGSDDED